MKNAAAEALRYGKKLTSPLLVHQFWLSKYEVLSGKNKIKGAERKPNEIDERQFLFIDKRHVRRGPKPDISGMVGKVKKNHQFENVEGGGAGQLCISWSCCYCDNCKLSWENRINGVVPNNNLECLKKKLIGEKNIVSLSGNNNLVQEADAAIDKRAENRRRGVRKGNYYLIRLKQDEENVVIPGEDPKNPGVYCAQVLEAPRPYQKRDAANGIYNDLVCKVWHEDGWMSLNQSRSGYVVKIRWMNQEWSDDINGFKYWPQKVMKNPISAKGKKNVNQRDRVFSKEMVYYDTFVWETMICMPQT